MKRKCKKTNIADREFIRKAVQKCFAQKGRKAYSRWDVQELIGWCDGNMEKLIDILHSEIVNRCVTLPPVRYAERYDRSNGKLRHITIEHIKQQLYDYIASEGLEDIASRIGHYQIACKPGQGPIFGANVIRTWMREEDTRYAVIADIHMLSEHQQADDDAVVTEAYQKRQPSLPDILPPSGRGTPYRELLVHPIVCTVSL